MRERLAIEYVQVVVELPENDWSIFCCSLNGWYARISSMRTWRYCQLSC